MSASGDRTASGAAPAKIKCADHTPCPEDYLRWHDWAEDMAVTHKQVRCPDCELFKIWVRK